MAELKPRWKRCAELTDLLLGEALGRDYVARYFPPEAKARAREMILNILAAMGDTIQGLDWMTPETKKKALEKLSTFNVKVGYPDKWKDYSSVNITPRLFLCRYDECRSIPGERRSLHHWQARGSRALGNDSSYLQRLLQPADE